MAELLRESVFLVMESRKYFRATQRKEESKAGVESNGGIKISK
jgi:hypothetical protein